MLEERQQGCITKKINGSWLTNGHLKTCILKLLPPSSPELENDLTRTENISIVNHLFSLKNGNQLSLLEQEFQSEPSLVLAPELAFGSPDFDTLNNLIKGYNENLIFICGFGFSLGDCINKLVTDENVEGIWSTPLSDHKKYNGGWVWIKNGDTTKCYIFLKNFPEQKYETAISNLGTDKHLLRLEGSDLVIFPTVCADLISKEPNSPTQRISKSLSNENSANKKILVTGSLLNSNSASGHWKAAIGDLLEEVKLCNPRLLLSNCINPAPHPDEEKDKWRCLSGVFQHRENATPPRGPLPNIRYVDDTKFIGFVLRTPSTGASFGKLQWTNTSSEGLNAFSECCQYSWENGNYQLCHGLHAADELYRFVLKNKGGLLHSKINSNETIKNLANSNLDKLIKLLSPTSSSPVRDVAEKLFQKCLHGVLNKNNLCSDKLYEKATNLDCAITTLTLIQYAVDATLMQNEDNLEFGQLLSTNQDQEILIWDSSDETANQLYNMVKENVVTLGGSARPLIVVGRGNGGGMPPIDGRIESDRLTDIANATKPKSNSDKEKDICEPNDRVVFWKNQGVIDEILSSSKQQDEIINEMKNVIEKI